jgi:hypothetical protein
MGTKGFFLLRKDGQQTDNELTIYLFDADFSFSLI